MIAIGLTDLTWFQRLREGAAWDEVNFWTPTPWSIRSLTQGDFFYFLLKAPLRKIGGYGTFLAYEEMSVAAAWNRFGHANGTADLPSLIRRRDGYVGRHNPARVHDVTIGCIVLRWPVFLGDDQFRSPEVLGAPVPNQVVKYKTFPQLDRLNLPEPLPMPESFRLVEHDQRQRLMTRNVERAGQRAFRDRVLQAYGNACAITGETAREVVEAAHVQPYLGEQSNHVQNGIALRVDLHRLFDAGLLTIDENHQVCVSPLVLSATYRQLHGTALRLPRDGGGAPSADALAFHRESVFRSGNPTTD